LLDKLVENFRRVRPIRHISVSETPVFKNSKLLGSPRLRHILCPGREDSQVLAPTYCGISARTTK
jgi:hypothetical protein